MSKIYAYMNHGRWVADCPKCTGAEIVEPNKPFVCGSCCMDDFVNKRRGLPHKNGHDVIFPEWKDRVDATLKVRPLENRNWWLGESLEELHRENKEHGLPEE